MALKEGTVIDGKYRIGKVLGRGGMGTVYGGEHTMIRRSVAIKVLKPTFSEDESMVERFQREAMTASAVRSRHVVEIFDVGTLDSGEHFIIMERLDGQTLSARLRKQKRLSPAETMQIASPLLEGLGAAHAAGIVHRDLKPANVHLGGDGGVVKVLDFGVSKFAELPTAEGFTATGALVGTPHYMSPEQTKGARHADQRSDLYSVGAILFRTLTGRLPLMAQTIHELIAKLITEKAPSILTVAPELDLKLAAIVDRALFREPSERFQTAFEMKDAVDAWLSNGGDKLTDSVDLPHTDSTAEQPTRALTPRSQDYELATVTPGSTSLPDSIEPPTLLTPSSLSASSFSTAAASADTSDVPAIRDAASRSGDGSGPPTPPPGQRADVSGKSLASRSGASQPGNSQASLSGTDVLAAVGSHPAASETGASHPGASHHGTAHPGTSLPSSTATPSPSAFDTIDGLAPPKRGVGLVVLTTVLLVAAAAGVAVLLTGNTTPFAAPTPATQGPAHPPERPDDRAKGSGLSSPQVESSSEASLDATASAKASAEVMGSAEPTPGATPSPHRRRRRVVGPRPTAPVPVPTQTPSAKPGRDFRTDI